MPQKFPLGKSSGFEHEKLGVLHFHCEASKAEFPASQNFQIGTFLKTEGQID
jgi:hypothetical protein